MKDTKIALSGEEMDLILNKEWLLLKRKIMGKIAMFLGEIHDSYSEIARSKFNLPGILTVDKMGKLARGENLKGLPYLMLDYPAYFSSDRIIAVRTLFWWGQHFSIYLHLSGIPIQDKQPDYWIQYFRNRNFCISTSFDQWDYEFNERNFEPFTKSEDCYRNFIEDTGIFRVARKIELGDLLSVRNEILSSYVRIVDFLEDQFPNR